MKRQTARNHVKGAVKRPSSFYIFTFLLFHLFTLLPLNASAQDAADEQATALFGYFSYSRVLESMPETPIVERRMEALRAQYDAEMRRAEDEFNKKYEEFLEGQREFAPSIYKKRQAELTELMQRNMAFKTESQQLLDKARADALAPIEKKISEAVQAVGKKSGYAFVINSDNNTLPYVDQVLGVDITQDILKAAKATKSE